MKLQSIRILIFVLIGALFLSVPFVYAETAGDCFKRGVAAYNQGNLSLAIVEYTKAIAIDPDHLAAYHNRGLVYSQQRNFIQAIADYTKVIEINPNYAPAYNNRGLVYHNRGSVYGNQDNFTRAIADYTKAIAIDPNYGQAHYNRGFTYFMTKEYDLAWLDIYEAEGSGLTISPELLDALKAASGRDR